VYKGQVRWAGESLIVPDSRGPAAEAGVAPGWQVTHINGSAITTIAKHAEEIADTPQQKAQIISISARGRMSGSVGESLALTVVDPNENVAEVSITYAPGVGTPVQLGQLPPLRSHFEHEVLACGVVWIRFNVFMVPIMAPLEAVMSEVITEDTPGVIIDLRGNMGGIATLGGGVAGFFMQENGRQLATMITRDGTINLRIFPRPSNQNYAGPVAVLVDELSFSTAEMLAGGLQSLDRARVFGTPTLGMAMPSVIKRLPNGDRLQYVFADLVGPNGERIEGAGIQPDEVVPLNPDKLAAGVDPVIEAAREWLIETAERTHP